MKVNGRPSLEMQVKHEAHVLKVAMDEFLSHGYKGTSFDAIARAAGVSRITLYRRFQTKEGLFLAVAAQAVKKLEPALQHVEPAGRRPLEVLEEYMVTAYAAAAKESSMAIVRMAIAERRQFPELARAVRDSRASFLRPVTAYIQTLHEAGVIALTEPAEHATMTLMDLCLTPYDLLLTSPLKSKAERLSAAGRAAAMFLAAYGAAKPGTSVAKQN